jgi:hypothetical protein
MDATSVASYVLCRIEDDASLKRVLHDARCILPGGQDRLSGVGHEERLYQPQLRGSL